MSRSGLFTFFDGPIHSDHLQNEIVFNFERNENDVNRILFMAKQNVNNI